jgi:hypothetical protein
MDLRQSQGVMDMYFMDNRALFFSLCWKEAAESSSTIHRFRTHTNAERISFERMLNKRKRLPGSPDIDVKWLFSDSKVLRIVSSRGQ